MNETPKHEFEKAGLGQYPYVFRGIQEKKFQAVPGDKDCPIQPGSSCDYCGTAIMYEFWLESADGKRFKVGCDCVCRTNSDPALKAQAKAEQKRIAKENRVNKAIARRNIQRAKWQEEKKAAQENFVKDNAELIENLQKYSETNYFLKNLLFNFNKYGSLTEKQVSAAVIAIDKMKMELNKKPSEHVGNIDQRTTFTLTVKNVIPFEGIDYYTRRPCTQYITILEDESYNVFVYKSFLEKKGTVLEVTATVKDHTEYKGVKQTIIQRPKVVKIIKEEE